MAIQVNKDAVSGLRALLTHRSIVVALSYAIVIAAIFGGLYLVKDTPILDAFKRDDKQLGDIQNAINDLSRKINDTNANTGAQFDTLSKRLDEMVRRQDLVEQLIIVSVAFNPNIPVVYRNTAFDMAKQRKMNHGIKAQYRDFVSKHPDAAWQSDYGIGSRRTPTDNKPHMVTLPSGVAYEAYDD
jgi:hypothetical protein